MVDFSYRTPQLGRLFSCSLQNLCVPLLARPLEPESDLGLRALLNMCRVHLSIVPWRAVARASVAVRESLRRRGVTL